MKKNSGGEAGTLNGRFSSDFPAMNYGVKIWKYPVDFVYMDGLFDDSLFLTKNWTSFFQSL